MKRLFLLLILRISAAASAATFQCLGANSLANDISTDGLTITGNGINPNGIEEAWLVTIPEPASILLLSFGIYWLRKQQ